MIRRVWWAEAPSDPVQVDARDDRHAIRLAAPVWKGFHDREVREVAVQHGTRTSRYLVALDGEGRPCGEISALGTAYAKGQEN